MVRALWWPVTEGGGRQRLRAVSWLIEGCQQKSCMAVYSIGSLDQLGVGLGLLGVNTRCGDIIGA